ncbi:hypothetical protein L1987_08685 [Smallanthus sonchifolius]|uniref:Uncharacterized protein n=1 Tax=Smallanthus sonchifolius TaxID=185202 RepID=A0ACB9JMG2_9ASTR|nr:hypothetical protein L1987_08685 [Smallanthus sonchifolius]
MSNSGKRGTAKGKKFTDAKSKTVEFNKDGVAIGPNASSFMSGVGLEFRSTIPYHLLAKDVDKKLYDAAWINIKKDKTPFKDYTCLEPKHWDAFAAKALSEDYQVKSEKAKISAKQNYEPARVGRRGCIGFLVVWEERWDQLLSKNEPLSLIQDERSKIYTTSRAHFNPVTSLYELGPHQLSEGVLTGKLQELYEKEREMKANGSYYEVGKDVVTEVVGKRGCSSLVSSIIGFTKSEKKKTKEAERLQEEIDALRRDHGQDATTAGPSIGRRGTDGMSDRLYNDLPVIKVSN